MSAGIRKDLEQYLRELSREGWMVESGKKAYKLRPPNNGGGLVSCSKTPSCPFSLHKVKNDVKRLMKRNGCIL